MAQNFDDPEFISRHNHNVHSIFSAVFDSLLGDNPKPLMPREDDEATDRIREGDERDDDRESTEELPGH